MSVFVCCLRHAHNSIRKYGWSMNHTTWRFFLSLLLGFALLSLKKKLYLYDCLAFRYKSRVLCVFLFTLPFFVFKCLFRNGWFCGFVFLKLWLGFPFLHWWKQLSVGISFGRFEKYLNNSSTDLRKGFLWVLVAYGVRFRVGKTLSKICGRFEQTGSFVSV